MSVRMKDRGVVQTCDARDIAPNRAHTQLIYIYIYIYICVCVCVCACVCIYDEFVNYNWVDTQWQQYSTVHIYTQTIHRTTQ